MMAIMLCLLLKHENFSIYYDPRFEYGYYAKEIIPQEAIMLVKKNKI